MFPEMLMFCTRAEITATFTADLSEILFSRENKIGNTTGPPRARQNGAFNPTTSSDSLICATFGTRNWENLKITTDPTIGITNKTEITTNNGYASGKNPRTNANLWLT